MPSNVKYLRRSLRFYAMEQYKYALLELDQAIADDQNYWIAYCLRGRVHAALKNYPQAIADYTRVLANTNFLNQHNRNRLLHSIIFYTNALSHEQKSELAFSYFKELGRQQMNRYLDMEWDEWCSIVETSGYGWQKQRSDSALHPVGRVSHFCKSLLDDKDREKISELVCKDQSTVTKTRRLKTYRQLA